MIQVTEDCDGFYFWFDGTRHPAYFKKSEGWTRALVEDATQQLLCAFETCDNFLND